MAGDSPGKGPERPETGDVDVINKALRRVQRAAVFRRSRQSHDALGDAREVNAEVLGDFSARRRFLGLLLLFLLLLLRSGGFSGFFAPASSLLGAKGEGRSERSVTT